VFSHQNTNRFEKKGGKSGIKRGWGKGGTASIPRATIREKPDQEQRQWGPDGLSLIRIGGGSLVGEKRGSKAVLIITDVVREGGKKTGNT